MGRTLFRSRAMSRSAGPEKLDERIRVVTVPGWISLAIGVTVAISILGWAALGTTRVEVSGVALLVRDPHTFIAESPVDGYVDAAPPAPGTRVQQGQQIASIRPSTGSASVPVLAPVTGTVASSAVDLGTMVVARQNVAYLELVGVPLVAQVFVPTAAGKRVQPGMTAQVEPSIAPAARNGRMLATVRSITPYSVSPDRIRAVVGNAVIAEQIIDGPPVLLVTLDLRPGGGRDGYAWTFGTGPPFSIVSGTLANATITISKSHPLNAVFGGGSQ